MDDGLLNSFRRFEPANSENPSFFQSLKKKQSEASLRSKLEDVLGKLTDRTFDRLKPDAISDFEGAVVNYLDNPLLYIDESERLSTPASPVIFAESNKTNIEDNLLRESPKKEEVQVSTKAETATRWVDNRRFIGSIQAEAWCTRSGRNLVRYNEKLKVDRVGTGPVVSASSLKKKDDLMVRFHNSEGLYFARAQESDARFIAVLIDADVCTFEATVIYADPLLRLGSTIYVQVDCFMNQAAFSASSSFGVNVPPKKKAIVDESKETREEKLVRLRQLSLVDLFNRLGLTEYSVDMTQAVSDANKLGQARSSSPSAPPTDPSEEDGQILDQDQLELFYNEAVSAPKSVEIGEVEPSNSFGLTLFPYQKRGLAWMLDREKTIGEVDENDSETHPLWSEMHWPEGDPFWANLNSGELSLTRPTLALRSRGGILADEMGLGKTISTLALIHTAFGESKNHSTLVVAPMSLLSQWESEIHKAAKTSKSCGCFIYYGNASSTSLRNSLAKFVFNANFERKIVITTYGMISSEHKQRLITKAGGLFNIEFDRIILDEAHTIKNRSTQTAKACFDLRGHRRWALTGTPVVNRLEDLYSLVRFIGIEPWNNFTFWRAFITDQFLKPETREKAMKTVQAVVAPVCLRRTKAMKDPETNRLLVELPSKQVDIKRIMFTEDEKALYSHLYARVRESVQTKVMEGTATAKYSAILTLLLRLRQVCCHPLLLRGRSSESGSNSTTLVDEDSQPTPKRMKKELPEASDIEQDNDLRLDLTSDIDELLTKFETNPSLEYTTETLKKLLERSFEEEECPICSENQEEPVFLECLHSACRDCLESHIDYLKKRGENAVCHICRAPTDSSRLFVVNRKLKCLQPLNRGLQSSKIRALITALRQAYSQGFGKAVVFSQFTSFLDLIETHLKEAGFPVFRFDGSLTQTQRAAAVDGFRSSESRDAVLLLSQKAGGVGLNLVVANHAYLMDPWWNFANESQAIDRIHRMGQKDDVRVTRFIIQGTIEERMLKIQEKKRALSNLVTAEEKRAETLDNIRLLLELKEGEDS